MMKLYVKQPLNHVHQSSLKIFKQCLVAPPSSVEVHLDQIALADTTLVHVVGR